VGQSSLDARTIMGGIDAAIGPLGNPLQLFVECS
jgi:hypothetical protein